GGGVAYIATAGYVNDITVNTGSYLSISNTTAAIILTVTGNINNNGTIETYGNSQANEIRMSSGNVVGNTAAAQIIQSSSGNGVWYQTTSGIGAGFFSGLGINNSYSVTPQVTISNTSFAVTNALNL